MASYCWFISTFFDLVSFLWRAASPYSEGRRELALGGRVHSLLAEGCHDTF